MTLPDDGVQTPRAPDGIRCAGRLLIANSAVGRRQTLHLYGELDLTSAAGLMASASLLVCDATELVLDLSGVDFMDSTGINAVIRLRDLCRNQRCRLVLASPKRQVRRLLEVTALIEPMRDEGLLAD